MVSPKVKRGDDLRRAGEILSVADVTLRRWVSEGAPHERRKGQLFFNIAELASWKTRRDMASGTGPLLDNPSIVRWRARKERALALRYELELRALNRSTMLVTDHTRCLYAHCNVVRAALLSLPHEGALLVNKTELEIRTALEAWGDGVLKTLRGMRKGCDTAPAGWKEGVQRGDETADADDDMVSPYMSRKLKDALATSFNQSTTPPREPGGGS